MAKKKTRRRKRRTKRTGKSISLGNGFRLNLSKSGVSLSGGVKGARLSVGNKGVKSTLSIPGTGISKTKTLVSSKDIIDKVKGDKDEKISEKSNHKKIDKVSKEEAAAKRVEAIESQFKTGDHQHSIGEKILDKDVPKSFIKEGFKTAWWIALIVLGVLILIFNLVLGAGVMFIGAILLLLEYQLPKSKAKRYFNTGIELYKEKKYEESMKEMEKAILFDPDHENMNLTIASIKHEVFNDTEGAIIHLTKVTELYQNKETIFLLSKCYFSLEEYVKTIELLQTISFRKAKERDRIVLLSRCYLLTNQSKLAVEILLPLANEYIINKEELIEVNYWLGYAYLDDFEFEQGREYLELVYQQDSEYKNIQRLIENIKT